MDRGSQNSEFFASKRILAPMVRAGRTPLRTLALGYGADLVYSEEIVDQKLLNSRRVENANLSTVDFINGDEIVLRIAKEERSRLVLQIGTSSVEMAADICRRFGEEVAAIDLNMGCPKPFSVHAGMGAALLGEPVKVKEILTAMVSVSPVPISCKIRVLDNHADTLEFVRMVERCGVSAVGVHGRRREERPRHPCRHAEIDDICRQLAIPVIANGGSAEIRCWEDIDRFRAQTGASSVMLARRAFTNPSIFRQKGGILPMDDEIRNFLAKACQYGEQFTAVKYVVQRILGSQQEFDPRGRATVAAGTVREICRIWGMEECFVTAEQCRRRRAGEEDGENGEAKRPRIDGEAKDDAAGFTFTLADGGIWTTNLSFALKKLKNGQKGMPTPKCVLHKHCIERRLPLPVYEATQRPADGRFTAVVWAAGKGFTSPVAQPNIKMAQQVAALVALHGLEIRHKLEGDWDEEEKEDNIVPK